MAVSQTSANQCRIKTPLHYRHIPWRGGGVLPGGFVLWAMEGLSKNLSELFLKPSHVPFEIFKGFRKAIFRNGVHWFVWPHRSDWQASHPPGVAGSGEWWPRGTEACKVLSTVVKGRRGSSRVVDGDKIGKRWWRLSRVVEGWESPRVQSKAPGIHPPGPRPCGRRHAPKPS